MTSNELSLTLSRDEFDNAKGFEMTLFYVESETADDVIFDPEGDERLMALHKGDVADFLAIRNGSAIYESLVTRSSYSCKLHPQLEDMQEFVAQELSGDVSPDEMIVLVYKRDSAARSEVGP